MEDKNKHNRLCDKSKEELVAIILRKDDVHNRLYRTNKFLKRKVEGGCNLNCVKACS